MGRELPCVRQLVEDKPPPQVLARQLRLLGPFLDIGLDQVQAVISERLGAQELWIELAQDPSSQEPKHEPDAPLDPGAPHPDAHRVLAAALLSTVRDDP